MADWKDIAGIVGKSAPLLGTLLAGPAGGAVGGIIASVLGTSASADDVSAALANPDAAVKLRQIEADRQEKLAELAADQAKAEIAGAVSALQSVNQTMQAEAGSDHWPTYTWRPFIGFVTGTMAFGVYFVLPLAHIPVPAVPESVWLMLGGILGVASWFRGKAQADPRIPTDNRG
jgi:hypothetical protein